MINPFIKIKKEIGTKKVFRKASPYKIKEMIKKHKHLKRTLNLLLTNIFEGIATSNEKIIVKKNCE